jgi:hypothetical protein
MLFSSADAAFPAALTTQALNLIRHASHHHDSSTKEIRAPPTNTTAGAALFRTAEVAALAQAHEDRLDPTAQHGQEEQEEGVSARGSG